MRRAFQTERTAYAKVLLLVVLEPHHRNHYGWDKLGGRLLSWVLQEEKADCQPIPDICEDFGLYFESVENLLGILFCFAFIGEIFT